MVEVVLPNDANIHCAALGGRVMHWIDMCGAIAAMRFTGRPMVTASVDELHFLGAIRLGEMAVLRGEVTQAWKSSVEVEVRVEAEEMLQGTRRPTTAAFLTFVAVDDQGHPTAVPPIHLISPSEKKRAREADERRERRLVSRRKIRAGLGLEP